MAIPAGGAPVTGSSSVRPGTSEPGAPCTGSGAVEPPAGRTVEQAEAIIAGRYPGLPGKQVLTGEPFGSRCCQRSEVPSLRSAYPLPMTMRLSVCPLLQAENHFPGRSSPLRRASSALAAMIRSGLLQDHPYSLNQHRSGGSPGMHNDSPHRYSPGQVLPGRWSLRHRPHCHCQ